jgi:hypothetical protein
VVTLMVVALSAYSVARGLGVAGAGVGLATRLERAVEALGGRPR